MDQICQLKSLTVKELINKLNEFPEDIPVFSHEGRGIIDVFATDSFGSFTIQKTKPFVVLENDFRVTPYTLHV